MQRQIVTFDAQTMSALAELVDSFLRQTDSQWDMQVIAERIGDKNGYGTFSQYSAILKRVEPSAPVDNIAIKQQIEMVLLEMIKDVLNNTSDQTTNHVERAALALSNMMLAGMAR